MLSPKEEIFTTRDGTEKTFILSYFPAVQGREIISQYPISATPKLGDYATNEALMLKIMAFVAVPTDSGPLALTTRALVDNHVPDPLTLIKIEIAMIEYNVGFSLAGKLLSFSGVLETTLQEWISKISTALSAQSSQAVKQPSKN